MRIVAAIARARARRVCVGGGTGSLSFLVSRLAEKNTGR